MLKERQLCILSDLENTKVFISAKALAEKYDVSLRTVRNDIDEIAYEVERHGGTLLRVPNKGLRVEGDGAIYHALMEELASDSFSVLEKKQQLLVLLSVFFLRPNPITVNFLAETFDVSGSTMTSRLKELEEFLLPFDVALTGVKKKGYYLGGAPESLARLVDTTAQLIRPDVFFHFFWDPEGNAFVEARKLQTVALTIDFCSAELNISPLDIQRMKILLLFVIKNNGSILFSRADLSVPSQQVPQFIQLRNFMNRSLSAPLSPLWEQCLRIALLNYTNAPSQLHLPNRESGPQKLDLAVSKMVEASLNYFPELSAYRKDLEQDLSAHICAIINRIGANLDVSNPLLEEIRIRFSLLFSTVKELSKTFTMYYPFLMDDNQISYLVLYFAEYLEKASEQVPLHILAVCNSGAGVAKLLSTRIRNHFPEVSVIENTSSYQLENGKVSLSEVDLIITTIPLRDPPDIPVVTTSPFLSTNELLQIRKLLIELSEAKSRAHRVSGGAELTARPIQTPQRQTSPGSVEFDMDRNIFLAEVLTEVFALFREVYPEGIPPERYPTVTGIVTHIVMSLPRWTTGDFIKAYDLEELKLTYPKEFSAIRDFLNCVGERLGIFIAPVEIAAILRYMINDW